DVVRCEASPSETPHLKDFRAIVRKWNFTNQILRLLAGLSVESGAKCRCYFPLTGGEVRATGSSSEVSE
ncbi:hypothetical protein KUCAC02_037611, partial [Chaenocephalus aceratus]